MNNNIEYKSNFLPKKKELIYVEIHDIINDFNNEVYCRTQKGYH